MSLGIMVSVLFILAATLTLLPAVLGKLGPRVDKLSLPWAHSGEHRSPRFARWGELLWRRPFVFGGIALVVLLALALPVLGMKTGMPSIKVVPKSDSSRVGYQQISAAFGPGAPGTLQVTAPRSEAAATAAVLRARRAGSRRSRAPVKGAGGAVLIQAVPTSGPSTEATASTIDRLRADLPAAALVGGPSAENHDLETSLSSKTPLAIGVILVLGFLLLLIAFQAPLIAAIGVLANLLSTAAAFGVATLIFQHGHLSGLLGFESQGFLDAWGPIFFFAMIFAIAMDYTVFLLSSAREHWEATGRRQGGDGRRARPFRPGDPRRRRGDGRGLLHLRALRAAAAEGDGHDPRRRRPARRLPGPPAAAAGLPAPGGARGLVPAGLARPGAARTCGSATETEGSTRNPLRRRSRSRSGRARPENQVRTPMRPGLRSRV